MYAWQTDGITDESNLFSQLPKSWLDHSYGNRVLYTYLIGHMANQFTCSSIPKVVCVRIMCKKVLLDHTRCVYFFYFVN